MFKNISPTRQAASFIGEETGQTLGQTQDHPQVAAFLNVPQNKLYNESRVAV